MKKLFLFITLFYCGIIIAQNSYSFKINNNNNIEIRNQNVKEIFRPDFIVLYSEQDPKIEYKFLRNYQHFAPSWSAQNVPKDKILIERGSDETSGGDGVDKSLETSGDARTFDLFYSAKKIYPKLIRHYSKGDTTIFQFEENNFFSLNVSLFIDNSTEMPRFDYKLTPKVRGFFSVGYVGSPKYDQKEWKEVWQPFVWKHKMFPPMSYLTPAFLCPLPTTLVSVDTYTIGVIVPPSEFPFQPLPTRYNNLFGVALRDESGKASPMVFAPVLGQLQSEMNIGEKYSFSFLLYVSSADLISSFENLSRELYQFNDYRTNSISTVNQVIDNAIDYSLSQYSNYIDSLQGYSYATDVPGSVKNVSSLHPIEIALLADKQEMFDKRALPIMEFMLSRKKDLFSLGTKIKIQNPSREMGGPCAYPSELGVLYYLSGKKMNMMLALVDTTLSKARFSLSNTWHSTLSLYESTKNKKYLEEAISGVNNYVKGLPNARKIGYWDNIVKCAQLLSLYETTGDKTYLDASVLEAKRYAMSSWFSPLIPNDSILVNKDNKAPIYWYLGNRGFAQQYVPEEVVPAWRLSEIGLLPESTITSIGHRAIFMAHHAPIFLRLAAYTDDVFLRSIAKSAVLGRYRSFPGYHINTERNTAQEKVDFPLRKHEEISVSSMHYNHILPFISNLYDFLISDVYDRSENKIIFPSQFIESYGYLVNRFYGYDPGTIYNYQNVYLWMPQRLLNTSSIELNYIAARDQNNLFLVFTNQLENEVKSTVQLNSNLIPQLKKQVYDVEIIKDNKILSKSKMKEGKIDISVSSKGITTLVIKDLKVKAEFQDNILSNSLEKSWKTDYVDLPIGNASAMLVNMGKNLKYAYVYLRNDDTLLNKAVLSYVNEENKRIVLTDRYYPFEFDIKLSPSQNKFKASLTIYKLDGSEETEEITLKAE